MQHYRLTHPDLDFWVTVDIHERDGRFMATADLGEDSRNVGVGETQQEAVRAALRSLGEPYASELPRLVREPERREGPPFAGRAPLSATRRSADYGRKPPIQSRTSWMSTRWL